MKNILQLTFTFLFLSGISNAQTVTISPDIENEYCPSQNYTFTVTIPGTNGSIEGDGNAVVISNASNDKSTFTFVGKFNDINKTQTFTIYYKKTGGGNGSQVFPFKKIKSLYTSNACSIITNPSTLTAILCQTSGIPYSFPAVKWTTIDEACFGSISTYEYLLPAGWKINGSLSDGSTWQQGSNSVTFTPDDKGLRFEIGFHFYLEKISS